SRMAGLGRPTHKTRAIVLTWSRHPLGHGFKTNSQTFQKTRIAVQPLVEPIGLRALWCGPVLLGRVLKLPDLPGSAIPANEASQKSRTHHGSVARNLHVLICTSSRGPRYHANH